MDRVVYNCPNPTPGARAIVTMVYYTLEYTIRNVSQKEEYTRSDTHANVVVSTTYGKLIWRGKHL